ncbi:hypothetical protein [Streptomyces sp. NPDC054765]
MHLSRADARQLFGPAGDGGSENGLRAGDPERLADDRPADPLGPCGHDGPLHVAGDQLGQCSPGAQRGEIGFVRPVVFRDDRVPRAASNRPRCLRGGDFRMQCNGKPVEFSVRARVGHGFHRSPVRIVPTGSRSLTETTSRALRTKVCTRSPLPLLTG